MYNPHFVDPHRTGALSLCSVDLLTIFVLLCDFCATPLFSNHSSILCLICKMQLITPVLCNSHDKYSMKKYLNYINQDCWPEPISLIKRLHFSVFSFKDMPVMPSATPLHDLLRTDFSSKAILWPSPLHFPFFHIKWARGRLPFGECTVNEVWGGAWSACEVCVYGCRRLASCSLAGSLPCWFWCLWNMLRDFGGKHTGNLLYFPFSVFHFNLGELDVWLWNIGGILECRDCYLHLP